MNVHSRKVILVSIAFCALSLVIYGAMREAQLEEEEETVVTVGSFGLSDAELSRQRDRAFRGNTAAAEAVAAHYLLAEQDYKSAVLWFVWAADQGSTQAVHNLGHLVDQGTSSNADPSVKDAITTTVLRAWERHRSNSNSSERKEGPEKRDG